MDIERLEKKANPFPASEVPAPFIDLVKTIADWKLPETGRFWDDDPTRPMSYGSLWGSNGERDFMRGVAHEALSFVQPKKFRRVKYPSGEGLLIVEDQDVNGVVIVQDESGEYRRVARNAITIIWGGPRQDRQQRRCLMRKQTFAHLKL